MKSILLLIPVIISFAASAQGTANAGLGIRGNSFAVVAGGGYNYKNVEGLFEVRTGSPITRSAGYFGLSAGYAIGLKWKGEEENFGTVKPYAAIYRRVFGRTTTQDRYVHNGVTETLSNIPGVDGWAPGAGVQITYGLLMLDFNYTGQWAATVGFKFLKTKQ